MNGLLQLLTDDEEFSAFVEQVKPGAQRALDIALSIQPHVARATYSMYREYVDAGFSTEQAFELVKILASRTTA